MKTTIHSQSKRWWALLLACLLAMNAAVQAQGIHITITSDYESLCVQSLESQSGSIDEPPLMPTVCQGQTVHYVAHAGFDYEDAVASWQWDVYGGTASPTGDAATITWGNDDMGDITVTATTTSGRTCSYHLTVRLVSNPVAQAVTVPQATGDHVIYVCKGEDVEFTDQSEDPEGDIAGYYWQSCQGEAGTRTYTLRNVTADCEVTHRVYNNCGCYGEESYTVKVLDGDPLTLSCHGTVCEGSTATYHALTPVCSEYYWSIEGGHLVSGQGTADITVLWDDPHDGYGVVTLDGTLCGGNACPNQMSVRIPIIQDGNAIGGQTTVCVGEAVVYHVPLYGSTAYWWSVTPSVGATLMPYNGANEVLVLFDSAGTYQISAQYRCDFLSCGTFESEPLTVVAKPRLEISGEKEICLANEATYATNAIAPDTLMTWTATDLGSEQTVYASATPEARFSTTHLGAAGRYLITAENASYCNVAQFVLTVKDPPPAPTAAEMDPDNPTVACRNSSILLKAAPASPDYTFVWMPACTTATPSTVMGDEASLSYGNDVCDINVYTYDRQLGCMSAEPYVHHVAPFVLAAVSLPSPLTVCPGTEISLSQYVPYQEEVIYKWEIEDEKQYCATLKESPHSSSVTLQVNELEQGPLPNNPVPFTLTLTRTYCSGLTDTKTMRIEISDLRENLTITATPDPVCQGSDVSLSCASCSGDCSWTIGGTPYGSTPPSPYTVTQPGDVRVSVVCNPYSYCSNTSYLPKGVKTIHVNPLPPAIALGCDGTNVYTIPPLSPSSYSFDWGHTSTNSWQVPASGSTASHTCTIKDLETGCETTLQTECDGCERMKIVFDKYDPCSQMAILHVEEASGVVKWTIMGGATGEPTYEGTNDSQITIPIELVGTYAVFAHIDGDPCYSADTYFNVDFIPDFEIEKKCTEIVIHNYSQYTDGSKMVSFSVDGDPVPRSFSLSTPEYPIGPLPEGTHTVTLVDYNGVSLTDCFSETVTIANSTGTVSITSENPIPLTACNNTAMLLKASVSSVISSRIMSTNWHFGDGSTYTTSGGNVYHTFRGENGSSYVVTVIVTDENGCISTGNVSISSKPNELEYASLYSDGPRVCPGTDKEIEYWVNNSPYHNGDNYTWRYPEVSNHSSTHNVQYTGDYRVMVTNSNSCMAEAMLNVPFLNKPTAVITPTKYYYCLGEEVVLHGEPGDDMTYTYEWTVEDTETGESETYTTGTVTFVANNESRTEYIVKLTVTNSDNCSADADAVTIVCMGRIAAPSIDYGDDEYCIDRGPVKLKSHGPVDEIHWSNGDYGSTAYYYYPTTAKAYYYDAESGCCSDTAHITVAAAPDFDGLLTGCYKVCPELVSGRLPVYGMLPVLQSFDYDWLHNDVVLDGGTGRYLPLWLPLNGYGKYNLNVRYFRDCEAYSDPLVLEESDECKCDSVSIELKSEFKCEKDCKLVYTIHVTVCNHSSDTICFSRLNPLFDLTTGNIAITYNTFSPVTLLPGGCTQFDLALSALSLDPMAVAFQLEDENCAECTKDFGIDLTPEVNCTSSVTVGQMTPNGSTTNSSTYYYNFHIGLTGVQNVLAVWSTPQQVVNYTYDGSTYYLDGLCSFDSYTLQGSEAACIHALVCYNDELCVYTYCTSAEALLKDMEEYGSGLDDKSARSAAIPSEPRLQPNPTTGEVEVVGTADKVTEVLVMDMNGRQMAVYEQTRRFDVAPLASGFYIVRVKTQPATTDAATKVTYIKLVKK